MQARRTRPKYPSLPAGRKANQRKRLYRKPGVKVIFSLGMHMDKWDLLRTRKLAKQLRKGDVYFKEGIANQAQQLLLEGKRNEALALVGQMIKNNPNYAGKTASERRQLALEYLESAEQIDRQKFKKEERELIEEQRKKGVLPEVEWYGLKEDEEYGRLNKKIKGHAHRMQQELLAGNISEALNEYQEILTRVAELVPRRDERIYEQIHERIQEAIRTKQKRTILVRLGAGHTEPMRKLREKFKGNSRIHIQEELDIQNPSRRRDKEVTERLIQGKPVSREKLMQGFVFEIVQNTLHAKGLINRKFVEKTAINASRIINEQTLKRLMGNQRISTNEFYDRIEYFLREHGLLRRRQVIPLP
ncbi:MAG: hypothetical protein Q7S92_05520 [Candidatus Diapherotrites archaeon]|nr:hypothetical protein [Candidatus Diapherotrites archaeon]